MSKIKKTNPFNELKKYKPREPYTLPNIDFYKSRLNMVFPEEMELPPNIEDYKRTVISKLNSSVECKNVQFDDIKTKYEICYSKTYPQLAEYDKDTESYIIGNDLDTFSWNVLNIYDAYINAVIETVVQAEKKKEYLEKVEKEELFDAIKLASETGLDELLEKGFEKLDKINEEIENIDEEKKKKLDALKKEGVKVEELLLYSLYHLYLSENRYFPEEKLKEMWLKNDKEYYKRMYNKYCKNENDYIYCDYFIKPRIKAIDYIEKHPEFLEQKDYYEMIKSFFQEQEKSSSQTAISKEKLEKE